MLRRRMMMGQSGGADYSQQYLTFTAVGGQSNFYYVDNAGSNTLYYSVDGGTTWTALAANTNTPYIQDGESIIWKANGIQAGRDGGIRFYTANSFGFSVSGNIMSLLHGDDFVGKTTIANQYQFYMLFYQVTPILDASNLVLPATTLATYCYGRMFNDCSRLIAAPKLPATTLVAGCYSRMFYGCSLLNHIECLATDISVTSALTDWVRSVAATGTFVKDASMTSWPSGNNGIPSGWTVQNA